MIIDINKKDESKIGVYKIENLINGKVYIGSTISGFKKRVREHLYHLNKGNHHSSHLQKAYNKYGNDSFKVSILEVCDYTNIIEREQYYIDFYQCFMRDKGYNILQKAYSSIGYKHTEETLLLISEISKRRGSHPNAINAMRLANLGNKRDENHSKRMSKIHSKAIIQLDLEGKYIKKWDSITQALLALGLKVSDSNISKCANGKCKSYKGFMWIKEIDYNPDSTYEYKPIINGIK